MYSRDLVSRRLRHPRAGEKEKERERFAPARSLTFLLRDVCLSVLLSMREGVLEMCDHGGRYSVGRWCRARLLYEGRKYNGFRIREMK